MANKKKVLIKIHLGLVLTDLFLIKSPFLMKDKNKLVQNFHFKTVLKI